MSKRENLVRRLALWSVLVCLLVAVVATSGCSDDTTDTLDPNEGPSTSQSSPISGEGVLPDGPFLKDGVTYLKSGYKHCRLSAAHGKRYLASGQTLTDITDLPPDDPAASIGPYTGYCACSGRTLPGYGWEQSSNRTKITIDTAYSADSRSHGCFDPDDIAAEPQLYFTSLGATGQHYTAVHNTTRIRDHQFQVLVYDWFRGSTVSHSNSRAHHISWFTVPANVVEPGVHCTGLAAPSTAWKRVGSSDTDFYREINLAHCGFASAPYVFTSLRGEVEGHYPAIGGQTIYDKTSGRFKIRISLDRNWQNADSDHATDYARHYLSLDWMAKSSTAVTSECLRVVNGSAFQVYNASSVTTSINTSACQLRGIPSYFVMLERQGSSAPVTGVSSVYTPTATGLDVYLKAKTGSLSLADVQDYKLIVYASESHDFGGETIANQLRRRLDIPVSAPTRETDGEYESWTCDTARCTTDQFNSNLDYYRVYAQPTDGNAPFLDYHTCDADEGRWQLWTNGSSFSPLDTSQYFFGYSDEPDAELALAAAAPWGSWNSAPDTSITGSDGISLRVKMKYPRAYFKRLLLEPRTVKGGKGLVIEAEDMTQDGDAWWPVIKDPKAVGDAVRLDDPDGRLTATVEFAEPGDYEV